MILETISSRDLLIDAYKFYQRRDARAHEALAIILNRDDMRSAVIGCLERARTEEDPEQQRLHCQAACFGKKFHLGRSISEFKTTCSEIRVRNVCQKYLSQPTTDPKEIVEQLLDKKEYDLALWAIRCLKAEGEQQLLDRWCEDLMKLKHLSDEKLAFRIQQTLGQDPLISYASIAEKAMYHDRITLAIKLIENEGQSSKKIPLLLGMKQYDLVLSHALATCDSNLIYSAIFKLQSMMNIKEDFIRLLKDHNQALRYYSNYLALTDPKKLLDPRYCLQGEDEICLLLEEDNLEAALAGSKKIRNDFVTSQIEINFKLSRFQQKLNQNTKVKTPPLVDRKDWLGLSISDTLTNLIALGHTTLAKQGQTEFKVTDKKFRVLEQIATNCLPAFELPDKKS